MNHNNLSKINNYMLYRIIVYYYHFFLNISDLYPMIIFESLLITCSFRSLSLLKYTKYSIIHIINKINILFVKLSLKFINDLTMNNTNLTIKQPFLAHCFALVICRLKNTNKWLCVKEINNKGWFTIGGMVEPGENFFQTAVKHAVREAGVDIQLKGILRIENSFSGHQMLRIRVIFYAESSSLETKQISNYESECANWFTTDEILLLSNSKPGLRGPEILDWPIYLQKGGMISSLNILSEENIPIANKEFDGSDKVENFFSLDEKDFGIIIDNYSISDKFKLKIKEISNKIDLDNQKINELFLDGLQKLNTSIIKESILLGADVNMCINKKKWTPLHYAVQIKDEELVKMLLMNGASPENLTLSNKNCFHFSAYSSEKVLTLLLMSIHDLEISKKLKILNYSDTNGNTPLHYAADNIKENHNEGKKILDLLVNHGADPNLHNVNNKNCYDIISEY